MLTVPTNSNGKYVFTISSLNLAVSQDIAFRQHMTIALFSYYILLSGKNL